MASKGSWLLKFCHILIASSLCYGYLDIEELKTINYGIDILSEPVVMTPEEGLSENTVYVTSKYGQQYQCNIPNNVESQKEKEEQEKVAMETGIPDLLKPMENSPCLKMTKDWWSYEFCYGKYIRQYHIGEDGRIKGEIMMLGTYESEYDWSDGDEEKTQESIEKKRRIRLYHTQQYVNGSVCELTNKLRRTEVRFICEEGSGDYIKRLDEPETCVYVMTVYTTKICHHPYLKPPSPQKTVAITCNPLLDVNQYQEYLDELEAKEKKRKQKEEETKQREEMRRQEEERRKYLRDSNEGPDAVDPSEEDGVSLKEEGDADSFSVQSTQSISDFMKAAQAGEADDEAVEMKMIVKMVKSQEEMDEFLKEIQESELSKLAEEKQDGAESGEEGEELWPEETEPGQEWEESEKEEEGLERQGVGQRKNEDDTDEELTDYDSELKSIKERYKDRRDKLAAIKDRVKGAMEDQFDDIIKEAQEELGEESDLNDADRQKAFKSLSTTLNKLVNKLDQTEQEISEIDRELGKFATYEHKEKSEEVKKQSHMRDVKDKHTSPDKSVESGELTEEETRDFIKGPERTDITTDKVKVRVTRMKKGQGLSEGEEFRTKQTEDLERSVAKELEQAGLKGSGKKIHVKIVTSGYMDDKGDSVHVLSDEESESFKNMLVSIIGGNTEATKQEEQHNKMQENYSFVWKKNKESDHDKTQSESSTTGGSTNAGSVDSTTEEKFVEET